jgi:hypothetical protein
VDTAFTKESLAKTVGRKFSETFKPYTEEYLKECGYVKLENVQEQLDRGNKPEEVFDFVGGFVEGFSPVNLNGKYNFIDENGKLLSPNQWFDGYLNFCEGCARVWLNGKYNLIDKNGKILSPNQWFKGCGSFKEGFAWINIYGKGLNYINKNGKILSPNQWFDYCENFRKGFGLTLLNGKWYKIDTNGNIFSR